MNQTKKRLKIIKLAISITDMETLQLQVLKLNLLKTDQKVQSILSLLREQNYVQAQRLITSYLEIPNDTVIQRSSETESEVKTDTSSMIHDIIPISPDQSLYTEEELPKHNTELFSLIEKIEEAKENKKNIMQYDAMLNYTAHDTNSNNPSNENSAVKIDNFFQDQATYTAQKNTFFNSIKEVNVKISSAKKDISPVDISSSDKEYPKICNIEQKFEKILKEYPVVHATDTEYDSVIHLLAKLSMEPYTEADIEQIIKYLDSLQHTDKAQAAQLLLICACTESTYAHFRLARAFYSGDLIVQNLSESFSTINYLAVQIKYPEAICDLAQFYENGIGIGEDKTKALLYYKEAMSMGIQRAMKHYERLQKKNKGFFSLFR